MGRPKLKIYGERNSGTNYLQQLLARNLRVRQLRGTTPDLVDAPFLGAEWVRDLYFRLSFPRNLGWKHTLVPGPEGFRGTVADAGVVFVCLTKNPYSWLLSLHRTPHHAKTRHASLREFLTHPWPTLGRENSPPAFASPMALWNAKTAAYVRLADERGAVLLGYEELVADPLAVVDRLAREHGLEPRRQPFQNVRRSTRRNAGARDFAYYRDYYLGERWRERLAPEILEIANSELDGALMARLGYRRIGPTDLGASGA